MRPIDADALKSECLDIIQNYETRGDDYGIGKCGGMTQAMNEIDYAPTIDAIPIAYLMKYAQLPTEFAIAAWRKQDNDAQEKQIKRLDKPMSLDDALNLVNEVFPLGQKEQEAR